jgi:NDP-sugar pyrophosphorylase family protein
MLEAVILAGGRGLRLKGNTEIPKPFLIIKEPETILDCQVKWLVGHGFEHIILAVSRPTFKYLRLHYSHYLNEPKIDISIEEEFVGTGGALRNALDLIESSKFYLMNVDDVAYYDPNLLFAASKNLNSILVQKAILPFGTVKFDSEMKVKSFEEKPQVDFYVSCGHYVLSRKDLFTLLPYEGGLEQKYLPQIAKQGSLYVHVLKDKWITINDYKQLLEARALTMTEE